MTDWFFYERNIKENGYKFICGVDEAGRGPLAGPVYATAVILSNNLIEGINDSKKISAKKRDILYNIITTSAIDYNVAYSTHKEIDELNILNATLLAMKRAVEGLKICPDFVLVDGNKCPKLKINSQAIIKGDNLSASIASASILAKVSRDRKMAELSKKFPEYMFDKHKGYGTKMHIEMIKKYGLCEIHRKSFLKKILKNYE